MASSARIDELRKKFDENPRRYFAPLANEYRKAGELEQALFVCEEYLPEQPGHMSGHIVYGQALFELGRHDEAKSVFQTALSLDPENLVALRHLGDIARRADDEDAARAWYQRVLEADPRNEEVAHIVVSMSAGDPSSVMRWAPPASAFAVDSAPQRAAPPVVGAAAPPPAPIEVAKPEETPQTVPPVTAAAAPPDADAMPEVELLEIHELLEIDDFSFAANLGTPGEPAGEAEADGTAKRGSGSFDGVTPALAAKADEAPESAPLDGGPAGDETDSEIGEALSTVASASTGEPVVAPDTEFPEDIFGDAFTESLAQAFEEAPEEHDAGEAGVGASPVDAPPPVEPPVRTFVTRTMAEVYLQQGHVEPALEIYQKLLAQRPYDDQLRNRVRAVEERSPAGEPLTGQERSHSAARPGPSIRDFLKALGASRNGSAAPFGADGVGQAGRTAPPPDPIDDFGPDDPTSPLAGATPHTGVAAHRTSGGLSLDDVFRAPRQSGAGDDFSFDEFFDEGSGEGTVRGRRSGAGGKGKAGGANGTMDAADDVAQFNAWLNGLKKT